MAPSWHLQRAAREALNRGYRGRAKGSEDEVLLTTAKSFWAALVFYATKLALNCSCQYTEGGRSCSASTQLGRCACVDAGRMRCPSTVPTNRNWSGLLIAIACPGSGFVVRALSLGWLQAGGVSSLRPNWTVTNLRSGEPAKGINAWA